MPGRSAFPGGQQRLRSSNLRRSEGLPQRCSCANSLGEAVTSSRSATVRRKRCAEDRVEL